MPPLADSARASHLDLFDQAQDEAGFKSAGIGIAAVFLTPPVLSFNVGAE
jgi:hypothetical protein